MRAGGEIRQQNFTFGPNSNVTREQLVEKYGEENADYLLEQFNNFTRHYERLAYIATPVPRSADGRKPRRKSHTNAAGNLSGCQATSAGCDDC